MTGRWQPSGCGWNFDVMLTYVGQRCATIDIDYSIVFEGNNNVKSAVLNHLDEVSKSTKADIFLLHPKQPDLETASFNGSLETALEQRLRCAIYGDMETSEHAKTRILIMIDQIVRTANMSDNLFQSS